MRRMLYRSRIWMASTFAGGTVFVLSGCEPNVRDTILAGVEAASGTLLGTFLTAFFQTLDEPAGAVGTVKAIIDHVPDLFA